MKNFNLKIDPLFPFTGLVDEHIAQSVVSYKIRNMKGTHDWHQCDYTEITQMLRNKKFFDGLVWLMVDCVVFDRIDGLYKHRLWTFQESAAGWHYWLDKDNGKWYAQDNEHTCLNQR